MQVYYFLCDTLEIYMYTADFYRMNRKKLHDRMQASHIDFFFLFSFWELEKFHLDPNFKVIFPGSKSCH